MSSGEYLAYAKKNRAEWKLRGQEVVAEMIRQAREKYGMKQLPKDNDNGNDLRGMAVSVEC